MRKMLRNTGSKKDKPSAKTSRGNGPSDGSITSPSAADTLENTQIRKFHTRAGHGFAAEEANAQSERLRLKKVEITGTNNKKNGPDRITDGQAVQTKYCRSSSETIRAAFDGQTGNYKYGGQVLEVPKEQYEECVQRMREKIQQGKVPGVSNPAEAENLVKKGNITHTQAKNICRAGNCDSLLYDVKTQAVTTLFVLGISFAIQFSKHKWEGVDNEKALKAALWGAAEAGGVALIIGIASAQVLRTQAAMVGAEVAKNSVKAVAQTSVGKKVIEKIAEASLKKAVHGVAAVNHVSKLLRCNALTAGITFVVTSSPDFYRAFISNSISMTQLSKNLVVGAAGIAGGSGGWVAGGVAGAAIGSVVPVVGTAAGALVGSFIGAVCGGFIGGEASKRVVDLLAADDSVKMQALLQDVLAELANDHLLSQEETERLLRLVQRKVTPEWLRDMYKAGSTGGNARRKAFAYDEFDRICLQITRQRPPVVLPSDAELQVEVDRIVFQALQEEMPAAESTETPVMPPESEPNESETIAASFISGWTVYILVAYSHAAALKGIFFFYGRGPPGGARTGVTAIENIGKERSHERRHSKA
jgi:hypothetical protein